MKTGIAQLPLHSGKAPKWLFEKMKKLAKEIITVLVTEYGEIEFLKRISDPFWFQSFGCLLGFDWHSSGLTTTLTAAIKEALKDLTKEINIFVCGGKGKTSRKTPQEIEAICQELSINPQPLIYASKISAKVDSTCIQDGYQLYHHCFIFTKKGFWAVIQQGMNIQISSARRYHWLSLEPIDFVNEPHKAICSEHRLDRVLNLVASNSSPTRENIIDMLGSPITILNEIKKLSLSESHEIEDLNVFSSVDRLTKNIYKIYEKEPKKFEELLQIEGIGPKTVRALSLISNLIYGTELSWKDPAKYSFAHGGKDGHPYPVDRSNYEISISILEDVIDKARLGDYEKMEAIKRLKTML